MNDYLAFIDYLGKSVDEKYIYRFDFTKDTDTVWGNYFNVAPAIIIPDLQPEENTISKSARVKFNDELLIAKKNSCFSMQDCFDKIISLGFTKLTEDNTIYYNDEPLRFDFGETYDEVNEKIKSCGYEFFDIVDNKIGDDSIIDELIDNIEIKEEKNINYSRYVEFLTIKINDEINHETLKELLFEAGYSKVDYINKEGEYSLRGYIVDIYSYEQTYPVRISFFGDKIEKISKFDETTQIEIDSIEEITLFKLNTELYG